MKISGVVIAKNEERCIARCIQSYIDICDEFILVDTGSTDATVEIAEKCGARIVCFEWTNSFADARNFAISQCKGDWIIMLDADEWFPQGHDVKLKQILFDVHGTRKIQGLMIFLHDNETTEDDPDLFMVLAKYRTLRVLRNIHSIRYQNPIHERALSNGHSVPCMLLPDGNVFIMHDGYRTSVQKSKAERNVRMNLMHWQQTRDPEYLHYIASDCYRLGDDEKGLEYYDKLYATKELLPFFGLFPSYLAISAMMRLKRPEEKVLGHIQDIYQRYPDLPSAGYLLADRLFYQNRLNESYETYQKTRELLGDDPYVFADFGMTIAERGYTRMCCHMARIEKMRGNDEKAVSLWLEGLKMGGSNVMVFEDLAKHLREEDADDAMAFWKTHVDLNNTFNLEQLMATYRKVKPGVEYLHFFEKWFERTGRQDMNFITMLIIIGNYRDAFDRLLRLQREASTVVLLDTAFTVAWLAGHQEWLEEDEIWPEHYVKMSETILDGGMIREEDCGLYITVLNKMVQFAASDDERVKRFLRPAVYVTPENRLFYLDILHLSDNLLLVQPIIDSLLKEESPRVRAQGYRIRMMIAYEHGDYVGAQKQLRLARECDPDNQLFKDYECWINEKLGAAASV